MSRQEELKQVVSDLRFRALSLLKACEKLEQSFPANPSQLSDATSWPALLGQYEVVAKLLRDLHEEVPLNEVLQHRVPKPTEVFADPSNGAPTMFVPLLLQTKLPPELERQEEHLHKLVKEEFHEQRRQTFPANSTNAQDGPIDTDLDRLHDRLEEDHNNVIDEADIAFDDARRELLKDCGKTVEQYSVREVPTLPPKVGKLIKFLETGDRSAIAPAN